MEGALTYTVCITGTTRGIGLELARQYAKDGWKVLACSRHPEAQSLKDLTDEFENVSVLELDVRNEQHIETLAKLLQGQLIDLLINSAGIYGQMENDDEGEQAFDSVTAGAMKKVFMVNAVAPLMISRALLPSVEISQLKTMVTISSRGGSISDNTSGGAYAYRPSKAAVNMVMKSLAVELIPKQIRVLLLHPGWVKTDMGGPNALIDVETSVKEMRQFLDEKTRDQTLDTDNIFFNRQGDLVPW